MRKLCALSLVVAVCLISVAANAYIMDANADVMLFKGDPIRDSGITVGGWGSGTAVEATDRVYTGSRSIKISTQGLHQGAALSFKSPIVLLSQQTDLNNKYLEFIVAFNTVLRSGFGLSGGSSAAYYSGSQEIEIPMKPKVTRLRIVVESVEGKSIEATASVPVNSVDGWYRIAIPFKALGIKADDQFSVSRIMIFGDVPDTMFLGQIGTTVDDTPITADIGDDQVVAIHDMVTFRAEAEGGVSMLKYSWNFGDRGPAGEDASGEIVTHRYAKGGDFTVKLTVSDVWGIKEPVVQTIKVAVND